VGEVGGLVYRQFDLSYINIIGDSNGLDIVGKSGLLVDHQRSETSARFLPEPEMFNWNTSYTLPQNVGRLHVNAQSAMRLNSIEKIVRLELTARGIPRDPSDTNRRGWFDLAHEWITRGFADSTNPILHKATWGRIS